MWLFILLKNLYKRTESSASNVFVGAVGRCMASTAWDFFSRCSEFGNRLGIYGICRAMSEILAELEIWRKILIITKH